MRVSLTGLSGWARVDAILFLLMFARGHNGFVGKGHREILKAFLCWR